MASRRVSRCGAVLGAVWLALAGHAGAGATVAIVRGEDPDKMVAEAIELLGGMEQLVKDGQKVVIKPNLVGQPGLPATGPLPAKRDVREEFTTDVRIVRALARQALKAARCTVTVAEGTPSGAARLFEFLGYKAMSEELGIRLVDVDQADRVTAAIDGLADKAYAMPAVTQTCDVLIDVAAMKTHVLTGVTLGMKNLFGLLPRPRSGFHDKVDAVICDLSRLRKPDLVVLDGLVAMEGQGPLSGEPVALGVLIAGRDVVAVDAVGCAVMGIDPRRIKHLRLAHERGIGEIDLAKIAVKGLAIDTVRREFAPPLWDAEVRIKATDARVGKLARMAVEVDKRWKGGSLVMTFRSGLRADREKYPPRRPRGFTVRVPPRSDEILFHIPYQVIYEENGQAACEEMAAWIRDKLGPDIEMTQSPSRRRDAY